MTVAEYIIKAKAEIAQLKAELEYLKAEQEVHGEIERARNILWAENKRLRDALNKYGRHIAIGWFGVICDLVRYAGTDRHQKCTCGFEAALKGN